MREGYILENKSRIIKTVLIVAAMLLICALLVAAPIIISQADKDNGGDPDENGDKGGVDNDSGDDTDNDSDDGETAWVVADYFVEAGMPQHSSAHIDVIEECFREYYYTSVPDSKTLAEEAISLYGEYCRGKINEEDAEEVTYALIDCLIAAIGDDYAYYRSKQATDEYYEDMSGDFAGIGVEVLRNTLENTILIETVHQGSPASAAGLLPGDYIIGVDGVGIEEIGAVEVINRIRGEVGTKVTVSIRRADATLSFEMTRAPITEETVKLSYIEDGTVALIKISGFKDNTSGQFKTAVDAAEAAGVGAIVFDLRNNGGGYLSAVSAMLSYLVPDGTRIASFSNGAAPLVASSGTKLEPTDHFIKVPVAVVVNSNSASASELFAAAVRDYNDMEILDGTVVGNVTYKKGVMQSTLEFSDGSTLTLTVALYNPPSGENFNGVGVKPDVEVKAEEDYIEKAIEVLAPKIETDL